MGEDGKMTGVPGDVTGFLGLGNESGGVGESMVRAPTFKGASDDFDQRTKDERRARSSASADMLFSTDISKLDDSGAAALYQSVTEGLFGMADEDGSMAFGRRASKDPRANIDMLRRFVRGEYSLIEDPEYARWRQMDDEAKFRYALENESTGAKVKSYLKGERGSTPLEDVSMLGDMPAFGPAADYELKRRSEIQRRQNYEGLDDEEKAKYRADVVSDFDKKLSRRQTLATFLRVSNGLSDRAGYLLAKSFADGRPDENVETLPEDERDRVYAAFSMMRGDQRKGRILGIQTDFTDGTALNRLQLGLYGFQQSVVGLVTDTAEMGRDAAMWAYAKCAMDETERREFFKGWDANVRAEQAMKQNLPEADGFPGEAFQSLAENAHWFIPYSLIGRGGKMVNAARGIKGEQGLLKGLKATLTPMRLGGALNEEKATLVAGKAAMEGAAAATRAAWTLDVDGVKKLGEMGNAILSRQMAAVDRYTQMLRGVEKDLKAARWWKDAAGTGMWAAGEASAFSAFASEYVANADAAGISREESIPTAAAVGLVNAKIEQLYVPGLESSLTPTQIKSLMFTSMAHAIRSDGASGFRKWLANRVSKGVTEGVKVTLTEGAVEEPLQQMAVEHGKAFDRLCGELRKNGQATLANEAKALWESFAKTLPQDYATFVDTAVDMVPSSVGFGLTTIGNMTRRQHIHNALTRHANRRAGSTSTMTTARTTDELHGATDYDAGLVDVIQRAVDVRTAVENNWRETGAAGRENPHGFEEAVTAARRAWRDPKTGDAVQEIADAAGVDAKTAEVLAQYLQVEAEATAFSPQARAWTALNMSLADIDESTIGTVLPGYVEGSFASDPDAGVYSGRVRMGDGTERTIAYRVGDFSAELVAEAEDMAKVGSAFGKSFDARHAELGDGVAWASLSDAQRYAEAVRSQAGVNGFSTGKSGVFELTDAKGEKVRVNADDVICLANGRIGDIGYGAAATQGTVRHETFHSLWRFARATLEDEDVQTLAKSIGIDITKDGWEIALDERMAHEMERYASGHYVSHAVSSRFDRMIDGWAGKVIDFFGQFGPKDEVVDPKTGSPYELKGIYDRVLRGELGSGSLGVELRKVETPKAEPTAPPASSMPVEVTDADRAEQETEAQAEADESARAEEKLVQPQTPKTQGGNATVDESGAAAPKVVHTAENPADAATPNQRYYKVGLPNSPVKLVGRLEVRDVSTGLVTSTDAGYHDRGNQNRDDRSEESRALVERIGANPDPLQIGTVQPIANNGIVWALPNGDVIIGNHRVNGVRLGYEKGTAAELEKFVRADAAGRGIEIGADVSRPLAVFVLERIESPDGKADVHEVVRLANESQNRGFNVREQAGNDAKVLMDNNLLPGMAFRADGRIDETRSGDSIGTFRRETGAQGMVAEDGSLTEEGQTRIQNAALAALLSGSGSNALLGKIMSESGRLDMQTELRAIMKTTPDLMALAEAKPAFDLRGPLAEALQLFVEWRDRDETARLEKGKSRHDWRETGKDGARVRGVSWEAFASQGDMFRRPSAEAMILGDLLARAESLRSFDREDVESAAGKKRVVDLVSGYLADYVANARAVNTETVDMFGTQPASRSDVLEAQRTRDGQRRFSFVGTRSDGIEVYSTRSVDGMTKAERQKEFLRKLKEDYKGRTARFTVGGKTYYATFGGDDAGKIVYGDKKTSPRNKKVKDRIGASGDIFDLVENARYKKAKKEEGKTTDAHRRVEGWDYFDKTVQVDDGVYDVRIEVRRKPSITGQLKDEFVYNVFLNHSKKKADLSFLVQTATNVGDAAVRDVNDAALRLEKSTDESIAQPAVNGNRKFSISGVYTGSAADYEKPSLQYIGTGEGSQVYGWGLYGSNRRGVANKYAEARSSEPDMDTLVSMYSEFLPEGVAERAAKAMESTGNVYDAADILGDDGDILIEFQDDVRSAYDYSMRRAIVYEQTFFTNRAPGDESHLLSWFEPVSDENMSRIANAIKDAGGLFDTYKLPSGATTYIFSDKEAFGNKGTFVKNAGEMPNGVDVYKALSAAYGSPKAASEFLARADIDGVKYPVDSYGGKQVKDGDEAGWNYVSFRDDNISVDHKWVDGQRRFSFAIGERGAANLADALFVAADLEKAREMLDGRDWDKLPRDEKVKIKLATSWEKGADGKWRREVPDMPLPNMARLQVANPLYSPMDQRTARANPDKADRYKPVRLEELFKKKDAAALELFGAYPWLRRQVVVYGADARLGNGMRGAVVADGSILLSEDLRRTPEDVRSTLTHEIQHKIQEHEDHARGGSAAGGRVFLLRKYQDASKAAEAWYGKIKELVRAEDGKSVANDYESDYQIWRYHRLRYVAMKASDPRVKASTSRLESLPGWKEVESERKAFKAKYGHEPKFFLGSVFDAERYASGGAAEVYRHMAGEVEARAMQRRIGMNEAQRAANLLMEDSEDVARKDQILLGDALGELEKAVSAESARFSVAAPLVDAMRDRERRALEPREPRGVSPYFSDAAGAMDFPVRALRTLKDEPEKSVENAAARMGRAARGEIRKRAPISVADNGDGTYTVVDGNATVWAAARGGLETVRAVVVGRNTGTRLGNSVYMVREDTSGCDLPVNGKMKLRTHGLDGLEGEAARERAYAQAEENVPLLKAIVNAVAAHDGTEALFRSPNKPGPGTDPREVGKEVKKRRRVDEKARNDYKGDYSRVVDLIGGTLVLKDFDAFDEAIGHLRQEAARQGASIAQVKKLNMEPGANGYQDVKVSIRFPNGGIGEVIVVGDYMNDAKFNRGGHVVYDASRVLEPYTTKAGDTEIDRLAKELEILSNAIYDRGPEAPDAESFASMKASASSSLTSFLGNIKDEISSRDINTLKDALLEFHLAKPPSVDSYAMPARSFIQNAISNSFSDEEKTKGILSESSLTVNGKSDIAKKFSTEAPTSRLAYPQLRGMSDDELLSAAVAARIALGKSDKVSDRSVRIDTVQKLMRRMHPEWTGSKIGVESQRVISGAQKLAKRIREDLGRGVSESLVLEHLPDAMRAQFGREMRQEAREGARLGAFGARANKAIEERQARIVEDAVRVQTGLDSATIENDYGINLSETIMHLAENPLADKGAPTPPAGSGQSTSVDAESEASEPTATIDAKVQAVVDDVVSASGRLAGEDERNRLNRRNAAGHDAENEAAMGGEGADSGADFDGDALAEAVKKSALDLENPRHLARFVAELARRKWIQEHGLAQTADVWRDLVAVQFLRKTAQSVYAKLCNDLVYSRSRETAMQRIARLDSIPTVRGLVSEMEFVGALINAQRVRDTQKQLCEKLDLFLRESFGAQGRFKPDKEEGRRKVSAEAELRARYMRHAMWLTPDAAAEEARQLQETLDALTVDFGNAGRDRDQSREFVETIRKMNVLREFGSLRYKPVGQIEAAVNWWQDFARGESDDIVREMSDREIRTKKAAHLLAVAFADPSRTTVREGGKADNLNSFITGHMGFVSLLQDCMRHASDADAAAVKDIVDYISREVQKSGDGSEAEKRRHNDAFHAAVEKIYGRGFNSVMKDMMATDDRFAKFMGVVGGKRVTPTKGRALQLLVSLLQEGRQVQVEDEENPGQTKIVWEGGYHDNIVKFHRERQASEIMALLTPADMNMLKWIGQWYEGNRSDLSDVCHSLFGIGVYAELPNYFPVKMMMETQGLEKGAGVGWTIFPKALTPRVKNERDFDTSADIFSMWAARMEEAAQWKHHAKLGLELRGIFGRQELRESVRSNHGASVDDLMQGFVTDILAGHGAYDRTTAGVQYFSDQIRGWTALCALGGNVGVMFKQTTSIPAFGFEIGLVNTAKYMVSAFTPDGLAAMNRIWNSEQRRTRWQVGSSEAVRNALSKQDAGWLKRAFQSAMITNKVGDAVPALVVGQGIYRDCLDRGMSEEDAMAETWSIVERTQQSGRMENQTSIQRRNKLGRIMFQFLSTQQQYLQYEVRAIREVLARPDSVKRWGNLGRSILLNHFILTSAYYWVGQLYKYELGQEPPEDELKDWVITCLLGPYGSLFVAGFCCKYTLERAIKGYSIKGGSSMLPMESWLKNQVNDAAKLLEAVFDSNGDTWDSMLDAAGRWMSDSNSMVRDLRKIYRYRVKGEQQKRR